MALFTRPSKKSRSAVAVGLPPLMPRLRRFAFGLTGSEAGADDLVQATCLRALERAHQFRNDSNLDRWAFTLCRSIWLNDLRAGRVRIGNGIVPVEDSSLRDQSPDAESNIFLSEVLKGVMALPDAQRETVMLVYVEGFSYREAAEILDIPIGTIMSRLSQSRKRLAHLNAAGTAAEPAERSG